MVVKWDPMFDAVCGADIKNLGSKPQEDSGVRYWLHGRADAVGSTVHGRGSMWASAAKTYGIETVVDSEELH